MGVPTSGRGDGNSGSQGGGDIRPLPPEHRGPVYHDLYDTGAMSGGIIAATGMVISMLVGSGRY